MKTYPVYLNGEFVTTKSFYPVTNPATGTVFARMCSVDRPEVAQAVQDAHAAFLEWRQLTAKARGEFLNKIAAEIERRSQEIARTITLENGKPFSQSQGEVALTIDHLRWFAEEGKRGYGRIIPHQADNKRNIVIKTPIGVVGAIAPWNFPLVLSIRKVAPALAAGCTAILKPASATPLSCVAFAEACDAAKLPKGVFQLIAGKASEIASEFLENPLVRKITFTGSTEVGKQLIRGAAEQVKMLSLELGGLAPLLVFDDADLDRAVEQALLAKFRNSGQACIAANRIYVQSGIYEDFLARFVEKTKAMKVGDGLEPGVQIGALIDKNAINKANEHVQDALSHGARLLCGGSAIDQPGHFFKPTVLADVPQEALCMREETFAPVAPIAPFTTEAQGIALANASSSGLSAYVFTRDINRAFRLMESIEAGMIRLNDGLPTTSNAPFGGVKQSGWGRELGMEGLDSFLETKHISIGV